MKRAPIVTLLVMLWAWTSASAALISGFEHDLSDWTTVGDVSTQGAGVGLLPTQGERTAFISTIYSGYQGIPWAPYSGTPAGGVEAAQLVLGPGGSGAGFCAALPPRFCFSEGGGSAMRTHFYAPSAGTVSFDWDAIGEDTVSTPVDIGYYSLWSDDIPFRVSGSLMSGPAKPSGVDLCAQVWKYADPGTFHYECELGGAAYNVESGWGHTTIAVASAGWYWIGFGIATGEDTLSPSVYAFDNVAFDAPEPQTAGTATLALLLMAITWQVGMHRRRG